MRLKDIQLVAAARQGDVSARCELGRRYLLGSDGFSRHIPTGLDYLGHPSVRQLPQAARIIAESMPVEELLFLRQEEVLRRAAAAGSVGAQVKLGAWLATRTSSRDDGIRWLEAAAGAGHRGVRRALDALARAHGDEKPVELLLALSRQGDVNMHALSLIAAREAAAEKDLSRLVQSLRIAVALTPALSEEIADLVVTAVRLAEATGQQLRALSSAYVEASLEMRCGHGDYSAAYELGRALCGIPCGSIAPASLTREANMRKGAGLLLRAAYGGCDEAWLHLHRLHANHRSTVANPQMARFFLEQAAAHGKVEAQRKLGASMLRESGSLAESEQAINWLYQAAVQGDSHAKQLLGSLVLPVTGRDEEAGSAIEEVRRSNPWLAVRLQLSRHFGLTRHEALTVEPAAGIRPWGLVVGKNPFIAQSRLSAPRAIPALSEAALDDLRRAAVFFELARNDPCALEGDWRRRCFAQRRAFERHRLAPSMFFAEASSITLDSLRRGPKWAFRAKHALQAALGA